MAERNCIYIKNMVCRRCILTVTDIFREKGISPLEVELGTVVLSHPLSSEKLKEIQVRLEHYGFEILDDKRMQIVEQIRVGVIEYVRQPELQDKMNLSDYLQQKCHREYSFLSKLFSEMQGLSIEKYCIQQKVERVKELLFYGELTVSEIADKLHYSSVAHLSAQFKSLTGLSPSRFRQMKEHKLKPLDEI
ncbi:helix-turn-helix domain-containing protein [Phocaeicola sp.]|uniref:helix-turn-helix domain-containing protein n=1 Tax=Phocaeicola sp. TaxID=2773926 RepID=UPI003A8F94FF